MGAHYAGNAIENSMLGATHACANPLTAHYGTTHGVAIAALLAHVVRWNWTGGVAVSRGRRRRSRRIASRKWPPLPACPPACGISAFHKRRWPRWPQKPPPRRPAALIPPPFAEARGSTRGAALAGRRSRCQVDRPLQSSPVWRRRGVGGLPGDILGRIIRTRMTRDYVEQRDGGYYVAGTRVSLDSIVYAFRGGESAETIQQNFPSLTLEQVYGAIAFYLGRPAEIDANIRQGEEEVHRRVPPLGQRKPEAYSRLKCAREQMPSQ